MSENNSKRLPHDHNGGAEDILCSMPDLTTVCTVAMAMKQLGDPSRLRIFWLLCHCEECVTNIAALVHMSTPAVSHHLRILRSHNLVETRREGKEMYYKSSETALARSLHLMIEELIDITCPGISSAYIHNMEEDLK